MSETFAMQPTTASAVRRAPYGRRRDMEVLRITRIIHCIMII